MGAWIEISGNLDKYDYAIVAPLVGAWIEMQEIKEDNTEDVSLLSWERGLKYGKTVDKLFLYESLLSWERGLKCLQLY